MRQDGRPRATNPSVDQIPWKALVRSPAVVAIVDSNGFIIQMTERFCRLFEYGADEVSGLHVDSLVPDGLHPHFLDSSEGFWAASVEQRTSRSNHLVGITKQGLKNPT